MDIALSESDEQLKPIEDTDMDSLFILPLSILPLATPALKQSRMVKNARLQSVVELFRDQQTGSGQVDVEDLPAMMGWPDDKLHPDLVLMRKLALLPSYDVYSLRITLRREKIDIENIGALKLSDEKIDQLTQYMMMFTRPLINSIYAGDNVTINSYNDILNLFRDPDVAKARERLLKLADTMGIQAMQVPAFLEDYADTFMSLSFFRHCLDRLGPYLDACLTAIPEMRKNYQLRSNVVLMKVLSNVEQGLNQVSAAVTGQLELFERRTAAMWDDITKESFQKTKHLIESSHLAIGGALCGLTVKMNAYALKFPYAHLGGPGRRADFFSSEMVQGLEMMKSLSAQLSQH